MPTSGTDRSGSARRQATAELDAAAIVGLLADDDRRAVVAALTLGATNLDAVVAATGTRRSTGLAGRSAGSSTVAWSSPATRARSSCSARRSNGRRAALSPGRHRDEHAGEPAERRKVLDAFVHDGSHHVDPGGARQAPRRPRLGGPGLRARRAVQRAAASTTSSPGATPTPPCCAATSSTSTSSTAPEVSTGASAGPSRDRPSSHYETLGLRADATAAEIRDAYRRLARRHHPDQGAADAEAMPRINEAYRVLGDPDRRASYDAALRVAPAPAPHGHRTRAGARGARPDSGPHPVAVDAVHGRLSASPIVLVGAALYEPAGPGATGQPPRVRILRRHRGQRRCPGGDVHRRRRRLVVEVLVPTGEPCPDGTAAHRDRQGRGVACVRSLP